MRDTIIAGLTPGHRNLGVIELPHPQRRYRVQDDSKEGLPNSGDGGGVSSIDAREAPMPQHQPWSDFTAAKLLPDSVYLWACDEPQSGGSRPSRTDAWVGWIVIITQMICYLQLIVVSTTELSEDSSSSSSTVEGSYSLISVAAAMFLMTSIAAADLGAGIALISEARMDMAAKRWVQRKMFGFMLLASFILLAAASIMMLFMTSSEDVELVVGAATVLFIADVDEKVMVVLKVIPSKWRLFWVLELISLSASLALFGLRVTGSDSNVSENGHDDCTHENADGVEWGCYIYGWYFILNYHPVSVTAISILVNAFVVSPKEFVEKHVFGSRKDWLFPMILAFWMLHTFVLYSIEWGVAGTLIFVSLYAIYLGCEWLPVYKRFLCCKDSDESNVIGLNFWGTSSTRFGLICVPAGVVLVHIMLVSLAIKLDVVWSEFDVLEPSWDWYVVPKAFNSALFDMWLLWCMYRGGNNNPERAPSPEAESHEEGDSRRLWARVIIGWLQTTALFVSYGWLWNLISYIESTGNRWLALLPYVIHVFAWTLIGVCAATSSTKGVAFWSLATYMLDTVFVFITVWVLGDSNVKLANF